MHANGDIERGYPPVLPLASRGALVGATPLLVTGTNVNMWKRHNALTASGF